MKTPSKAAANDVDSALKDVAFARLQLARIIVGLGEALTPTNALAAFRDWLIARVAHAPPDTTARSWTESVVFDFIREHRIAALDTLFVKKAGELEKKVEAQIITNKGDAKDIMSCAFEKFRKRIDSFDPAVATLENWVFGSLHRVVIECLRGKTGGGKNPTEISATSVAPDEKEIDLATKAGDEANSPDEKIIAPDSRRVFRQFMEEKSGENVRGQFNRQDFETYKLTYEFDLKPCEIAERLRITSTAVLQRQCQMRLRLRTLLEYPQNCQWKDVAFDILRDARQRGPTSPEIFKLREFLKNNLNAPDFEIYKLTCEEKLAVGEIAIRLGISVTEAQRRQGQTRRSLQELLKRPENHRWQEEFQDENHDTPLTLLQFDAGNEQT